MRTTLFPAIFSAKFLFVDEDGTEAVATYNFPVTRPPTEDDISAAIANITSRLPEGFRPMTRAEALNHYLHEEGGVPSDVTLALPPMEDGEVWWKGVE